MNENLKSFIDAKVKENNNLTYTYLKDLIVESEELLAVYELSGPKHRDEATGIRLADSKIFLLTSKRIIIFIIDSDLVTIKYYNLKDIRSFKILRENYILTEQQGIIPAEGLKKIEIYLKFKENDKDYFELDFKPDINGPIPLYEQKINAFNFIIELNKLII